jgi:hypothetical protein
MRVRHVIIAALIVTTMGLSGCAVRPPEKTLVIGTTYTAALSMAMLKFKVLSYKGDGWYTVQLIGSNMAPFSTTKPAMINSHALSILQKISGD